MGASTLRLLSASAVLAIGVALAPAAAAAAAAAPVHVVGAWSTAATDPDVASLTAREARLDAAAQHADESGSMALVRTTTAPPAWLLLLLVPILLGGAAGLGVTLHRIR